MPMGIKRGFPGQVQVYLLISVRISLIGVQWFSAWDVSPPLPGSAPGDTCQYLVITPGAHCLGCRAIASTKHPAMCGPPCTAKNDGAQKVNSADGPCGNLPSLT